MSSQQANRPPDAALDPISVVFLELEQAAERALLREQMQIALWRSRYRRACWFGTIVLGLLAWSLMAWVWHWIAK